MVSDYRLARAADERAFEDGGFRDDAPRSSRPMITFRVWLERFEWPRPERLEGGSVAA